MATLSVKHKFTSAKGDGPDSTRVRPGNWNAEHDLVVDGDNVVLGRAPGSGPGPIEALPAGTFFPIGAVIDFAGAVAPEGWLLCYGQLVSRTTEAALFAVIGTAYGAGDGSTTFRLPDCRGTTTAGKTDMGGADRGNLGGGTVLGTYMGGQTHPSLGVTSSGLNNINFGNVGFVQTSGNVTDIGAQIGNQGSLVPYAPPNSPVTVTGYVPINANFNITVGGGTGPFSLVQPTIVFNKIIKR